MIANYKVGYFALFIQIVFSQTWYAGNWNSQYTSGMLRHHPLNIIIRIEVVDAESRTPLTNADVRIEGIYTETGTNSSSELIEVEKAFELATVTESSGIAVFSLRWNKEEAIVRRWGELDEI
mgnify:CR=1 FL=1